MTIDEAREQMINFEGTMECPSYEAVEFVIKALEELKWWREQDLIRRDHARRVLFSVPPNEQHIALERIPKAKMGEDKFDNAYMDCVCEIR